MDIGVLENIIVMLGLSVLVIYFFHKLKLPSLLGFLITGIAFGPSGIGLIESSSEIESMSETGIIMLLFVIGLEFSLKSLVSIKRTVLVGGSSQVLFTIVLITLLALTGGYSFSRSLFLGFLFCLSSTAIVLKLLQDRGEMKSPHGKIALGILIFQDIIVVPLMLFIPMLGHGSTHPYADFGILLAKAALVVVLVLLMARNIVPRIMSEIAQTRSRELFLLSVIVICFSVALATSAAGLSLALGAFLAGLTISESEYSHQATGLLIPFREAFSSFFFISIGLLLDLSFVWNHLPFVLLLTGLVMAIKAGLILVSVNLLRYPFRTAFISALALSQVGEFAFILCERGQEYQLLDDSTFQYFLSVSIISMAVTPFLLAYSGRFSDAFTRGLPGLIKIFDFSANRHHESYKDDLNDHLVILGYGLNGQYMARLASKANIPFVVVDINPVLVKAARAKGYYVIFGDVTNPFILEHIHIQKARMVVIAMSDPVGTAKTLANIRSISNSVHVVVRCHTRTEMKYYLRLGANEVVVEELETAIEIFTRILTHYLVPLEEVEEHIHKVRDENYEMMRPKKQDAGPIPHFRDINVSSVQLNGNVQQLHGCALKDSGLRSRFGLNVVAIVQDGVIKTDIVPDTKIYEGDTLYIIGRSGQVRIFSEFLKTGVN